MGKPTKTALKRAAENLTGMIAAAISDCEADCSPERLESIAAALRDALAVLTALNEPTPRAKGTKPAAKSDPKAEEESVAGRIILPPVMEAPHE